MKRLKRKSIHIAILLLMVLLLPQAVHAAEFPEISKIEEINHYEWENVCIYASDVSYTSSKTEQLMNENKLEETIIADAKPEVRTAPNYDVVDGGISGAEISQISSEINESGYSVRLYVKNNPSCYIDILVKVTADAILDSSESVQQGMTTKQENEIEEINDSDIHTEGSNTVNDAENRKAKDQKETNYTRTFVIYSAIIVIVGILGYLDLRNSISVLRWYSKKIKNS
ncbi:hypothetical protein LJC18_03735 [Lachnospiraceae bacterium OttesenSCG-928-E19]|nr:hypothetical protein [Lachnospiraceae bacterium OttesenSCG-928-E19]